MTFPRSALLLWILFAGCASQDQPEPSPKKQAPDPRVQVAEAQLIAAYGASKRHVACQRLFVEANAPFMHNLGLPGGEPAQAEGPGYKDKTWKAGSEVVLRRPGEVKEKRKARSDGRTLQRITLTVGNTIFLVNEAVTVRCLYRAPPTLTARATGLVMVIDEKGQVLVGDEAGRPVFAQPGNQDATTFQEVRFEAGQVRAKR